MGKRGVLMLQRLVRCVIIGFWLGTMGTFLLREWQYHRSLPPALTESFTDATTEPIEWHVFRRTRGPDGQWLEPMAVGVIVSQVQRDEQSGIVCIVHQLEMDVGQVWHELPIPESAGQLRLESRLDAGLFGELQRLRIVGGWSAWGRWLIMLDVIPRHDGEATLRWMLNLPGGVWRAGIRVTLVVESAAGEQSRTARPITIFATRTIVGVALGERLAIVGRAGRGCILRWWNPNR
jgi:hypothetical protein